MCWQTHGATVRGSHGFKRNRDLPRPVRHPNGTVRSRPAVGRPPRSRALTRPNSIASPDEPAVDALPKKPRRARRTSDSDGRRRRPFAVSPHVRRVRADFDRKPSIRFLPHPSEEFFVRTMEMSRPDRTYSGGPSGPDRPASVGRAGTFVVREPYGRATGGPDPRSRCVPNLQALRNVAAFKSFYVAVKTGVSNVIQTVSSPIQRVFTWAHGRATEPPLYCPSTVFPLLYEGCR